MAGTEQRHGWYDLPSGGLVKFEDGYPVRLSDGGHDDLDEHTIVREAETLTGYALYPGEWSQAQGEPDATARVEIHVFVDSSDDRSRTYDQWDEMQQPIFEAIDAALPADYAVASDAHSIPADEGVMYTGPAALYDLIVAAVAGRCAVYRG